MTMPISPTGSSFLFLDLLVAFDFVVFVLEVAFGLVSLAFDFVVFALEVAFDLVSLALVSFDLVA